jgi:hypothetical protein
METSYVSQVAEKEKKAYQLVSALLWKLEKKNSKLKRGEAFGISFQFE